MSDEFESPDLYWRATAETSWIDARSGTDWLVEGRPKWEQGDEASFPASEGGLVPADLCPEHNVDNPRTGGLYVDDATLTVDGSIPAMPSDSITVESSGTLDLARPRLRWQGLLRFTAVA